jgi:hypothetical protein
VEHLRSLAAEGVKDVVVAPIGFLSDHMEVVYDLDTDARARAVELGLNLVRAATVGTHPRFVRMIRELVVERTSGAATRPALGTRGPRARRVRAGLLPGRKTAAVSDVLFTGFPGFIGMRLLPRILEPRTETHVVCLGAGQVRGHGPALARSARGRPSRTRAVDSSC